MVIVACTIIRLIVAPLYPRTAPHLPTIVGYLPVQTTDKTERCEAGKFSL